MKNRYSIYFILSFLLFSFNAFSQLEKGTWLIDARANWQIENGKSFFYNSWKLNPKAGYFLIKHLAIGTEFSSKKSKTVRSPNSTPYEEINFEIAPFARFYFFTKKFRPFLECQYQFQQYKVIAEFPDFFFPPTETFKDIIGKIGFNFSLSENVAFHASWNYRFKDEIQNFPREEEYFGFFNEEQETFINIGFEYFLNPKKQSQKLKNEVFLADKYLKAGNQNIGITGINTFKKFQYVGNVFWKGFLSNRLRLATISEIVLTDINFIPDRWHGIYIGRIAFDYFIPLTKNVFLTPTAGINFSYAFFSNRHLYLSGNIHPKLVYFLKNQLLEVGFLVRTPGKRIAGPTEADSDIENWEGSIVLAFEQFLQNNLSLRLEYRGGIFGDRFHGEIIFNENPIPSNDFRIGMNYFF